MIKKRIFPFVLAVAVLLSFGAVNVFAESNTIYKWDFNEKEAKDTATSPFAPDIGTAKFQQASATNATTAYSYVETAGRATSLKVETTKNKGLLTQMVSNIRTDLKGRLSETPVISVKASIYLPDTHNDAIKEEIQLSFGLTGTDTSTAGQFTLTMQNGLASVKIPSVLTNVIDGTTTAYIKGGWNDFEIIIITDYNSETSKVSYSADSYLNSTKLSSSFALDATVNSTFSINQFTFRQTTVEGETACVYLDDISVTLEDLTYAPPIVTPTVISNLSFTNDIERANALQITPAAGMAISKKYQNSSLSTATESYYSTETVGGVKALKVETNGSAGQNTIAVQNIRANIKNFVKQGDVLTTDYSLYVPEASAGGTYYISLSSGIDSANPATSIANTVARIHGGKMWFEGVCDNHTERIEYADFSSDTLHSIKLIESVDEVSVQENHTTYTFSIYGLLDNQLIYSGKRQVVTKEDRYFSAVQFLYRQTLGADQTAMTGYLGDVLIQIDPDYSEEFPEWASEEYCYAPVLIANGNELTAELLAVDIDPVCLIASVYVGERLVKTAFGTLDDDDILRAALGDMTQVVGDTSGQSYTVKVFAWDGLTAITPLRSALTATMQIP